MGVVALYLLALVCAGVELLAGGGVWRKRK